MSWAAPSLTLALMLAALGAGCASSPQRVADKAQALDAVIVPGCPNRPDGHLSLCQAERAVWASILWERGATQHFITSGAAVHSPYEEAASLAAAMVALGVPAERIELESRALHTDENMFYALLIARARGYTTLGVASQPGQAGTACRIVRDWGQACTALPSDRAQVIARHRALGEPLFALKSTAAVDFMPLRQREEQRAAGGPRRPPSYLYYLRLAWLRSNALTATPPLPEAVLLETYADRQAGRAPHRVRPRDPLRATSASGAAAGLASLPRVRSQGSISPW